VPWGRQASLILALANREEGACIVCLDPSATEIAGGVNLASEPRDTVHVKSVKVTESQIINFTGDTYSFFALGAIIRAQQIAGAVQSALDSSVQYSSERSQFGRPLSKFQAIQQQLAVMAGQVAAANASADSASASWGGDKAVFSAAVAKSRSGEAGSQVASIAHQVHGAMGFTREHSLHYCTRRLWSWRDEFGSDAFWQGWLGKFVMSVGAEELWPFLVKNPQADGEM